MGAIYPVAVRNFTVHDDYVEIVDASHVNALQDEVTAVESTLGVSPHIYAPTGAKSTVYPSVGGRLDSHERSLAAQQGQIDTLLAASRVGWATPALTVSGYSNPPVRLMPVSGYVDPGPTPVAWTSASVNTGGMYVPGASTVAIAQGGLWSIDVSITCTIDWVTLDSVQAVYNNLHVVPVPIAFQRVGVSIWVQGSQVAYGPETIHWIPVGVRPLTLTGGNPPQTYHQLAAGAAFLGSLATGAQVQVKTEQFYGAITGALVTAAFKFERSIEGVD